MTMIGDCLDTVGKIQSIIILAHTKLNIEKKPIMKVTLKNIKSR